MDQLNPGLKNLVNLGKSYEKSVTGNCRCHSWDALEKALSNLLLKPPPMKSANTRPSHWVRSWCVFLSPRSNDPGWKGLFWCRVEGGRERHGLAGLQRAWWVFHCLQVEGEPSGRRSISTLAIRRNTTPWFAPKQNQHHVSNWFTSFYLDVPANTWL